MVLLFTSCMWGVPNKLVARVTQDTLAYTYKIIKQRGTDCKNETDSTCTIAQVKYPVFTSSKTLNDTISRQLCSTFASEKNDTTLQQLVAGFFKEGNDFRKDNPANTKVYFSLNLYAKVLRQDSSLTTLEIGGYQFTGGAHGVTYVHFLNWDSKANKNLKLSDILVDGYESKLTKTAEILFRKEEELSATASLKDDYFFKDGKFALNNNYLITPTGLRFLYNIYEIKLYAAGRTELDIPWFQVKYLLKPNTIISQYVK